MILQGVELSFFYWFLHWCAAKWWTVTNVNSLKTKFAGFIHKTTMGETLNENSST